MKAIGDELPLNHAVAATCVRDFISVLARMEMESSWQSDKPLVGG